MGTTPDMIDSSLKRNPDPAKVEPMASWMRAPAESMSQIMGLRLVGTVWRVGMHYASAVRPIEPVISVEAEAMREAGGPPMRPKPVTTPSAGVSLPFIAGETLAGVASSPISWKEPGSKSRSIRSRTVSLPSACCRAMASAPPIARARWRRARSASTSSFIPMAGARSFRSSYCSPRLRLWLALPSSCSPRRRLRLALPSSCSPRRRLRLALPFDDGDAIGVDPGVGRRAADDGEHRGHLAPVMRGVIHHVLEQRPQGYAELGALGVLVLDGPNEVRVLQALDEGPLLRLEGIPPVAQLGHRREVLVAEETRGRLALPAGQPYGVRRVEMGEHGLEGGKAPMLAQVAPGRLRPQRIGDVEETAVRPSVIVVVLADQRGAHAGLLVDDGDGVAFLHRLALGHLDLAHHASARGLDRDLHLHRLQHDDGIAGGQTVARLAGDLEHDPGDVGLDLLRH